MTDHSGAPPTGEAQPDKQSTNCESCGGGGYLTIASPPCPKCNKGLVPPRTQRMDLHDELDERFPLFEDFRAFVDAAPTEVTDAMVERLAKVLHSHARVATTMELERDRAQGYLLAALQQGERTPEERT